MSVAAKPKRVYRCGDCGRVLRKERWVYSSWTGARYCYPGEGCWNKKQPRR